MQGLEGPCLLPRVGSATLTHLPWTPAMTGSFRQDQLCLEPSLPSATSPKHPPPKKAPRWTLPKTAPPGTPHSPVHFCPLRPSVTARLTLPAISTTSGVPAPRADSSLPWPMGSPLTAAAGPLSPAGEIWPRPLPNGTLNVLKASQRPCQRTGKERIAINC